MKYFLYTRKSEEDKNRQVKSIATQIHELRERFPEADVVEVYEEARTAKQPGRPLFDAMVERIRRGEAQGILVWSINRLLRNPVDQGTIQWLLQRRQLLSIQTMDKEHTSNDNVLILNVESGVANQFIIDLSKGTLRGLNSKVAQGWFPHRAPEGYTNSIGKPQGERDIVIDPVRFPLLRRAWEMMLTGGYSVPQVRSALVSWGYVPKPHAKSIHGKLSKNSLYRIFANRFYAGHFPHNGTWHQGLHKPMVTEDEFNRVQAILGNPSRVAPQKHAFAYTGLMRCGRCGCQITAEVKNRATRDGVHTHVYYHCSDSRRVCTKKSIKQSDLEDAICEQMEDITIAPHYRGILTAILTRYYEPGQRIEEQMMENQQNALLEKRKERNNLLGLRLKELIDDELFTEKKAELDGEVTRIEADLRESSGVRDGNAEVVENVLHFATEPKGRYRDLGMDQKRLTALHLGASYVLTDGKLALGLSELLVPVRENAERFEADCAAFERQEFGSESNKKEAFDRLVSVWGPTWNDIRTKAEQSNLSFPRLVLTRPIQA